MRSNRNGFTLIELMVVILIIGILAAVAVLKLGGSKDKAMLAAVKTDVRNAETAQEAYFSDYKVYGTLAQLQTNNSLALSPGNTMVVSTAPTGYTVTATNSAIVGSVKQCTVQVGAGASSTVDGRISCP